MMTFIIVMLLAQVALVSGQIFLKHGTTLIDRVPRPTGRVVGHISAGIAISRCGSYCGSA